MKYIRKTTCVDAEQYIKDGEVPVLKLLGLDTGGLHRENEHAKFDCYQPGVSTLILKAEPDIPFDEDVKVEYGDWVVKYWDGNFDVYDNQSFNEIYAKYENL